MTSDLSERARRVDCCFLSSLFRAASRLTAGCRSLRRDEVFAKRSVANARHSTTAVTGLSKRIDTAKKYNACLLLRLEARPHPSLAATVAAHLDPLVCDTYL